MNISTYDSYFLGREEEGRKRRLLPFEEIKEWKRKVRVGEIRPRPSIWDMQFLRHYLICCKYNRDEITFEEFFENTWSKCNTYFEGFLVMCLDEYLDYSIIDKMFSSYENVNYLYKRIPYQWLALDCSDEVCNYLADKFVENGFKAPNRLLNSKKYKESYR